MISPPFRLGAALAGLLILLLWGAGCSTISAPDHDGSLGQPALRVGIAPPLPPMVFEQRGEYQGVEPDLARALAEHLSRPLRFVALDWEELIPALMDQRIDIIMSGLSITPARQVRVNFTQPYLRMGQLALVRRADLAQLQLGLLSDTYRVGAQKGTTGEQFVQQYLPRSTCTTFSDPREGAAALVKNRIDVFIHDAPVNWWLASTYESAGLAVLNTYLTEEYLAWGVNKNNAQLLAEANQFIDQARTNGRMRAIVRNWLPNL